MPRTNYRDIVADMTARITAGEYAPGAKLPSYAELAEMYGVSRGTAAKAYLVLSQRGLVEGDPGRGVYVKEPPATHPTNE